jgi:hypothetical protein
MDEVTVLRPRSVFAGELLVQKTQVDRAFGEGVRLGGEGEPALSPAATTFPSRFPPSPAVAAARIDSLKTSRPAYPAKFRQSFA